MLIALAICKITQDPSPRMALARVMNMNLGLGEILVGHLTRATETPRRPLLDNCSTLSLFHHLVSPSVLPFLLLYVYCDQDFGPNA